MLAIECLEGAGSVRPGFTPSSEIRCRGRMSDYLEVFRSSGFGIMNSRIWSVQITAGADELAQGPSGRTEGVEVVDRDAVFVVGAAEVLELHQRRERVGRRPAVDARHDVDVAAR